MHRSHGRPSLEFVGNPPAVRIARAVLVVVGRSLCAARYALCRPHTHGPNVGRTTTLTDRCSGTLADEYVLGGQVFWGGVCFFFFPIMFPVIASPLDRSLLVVVRVAISFVFFSFLYNFYFFFRIVFFLYSLAFLFQQRTVPCSTLIAAEQ